MVFHSLTLTSFLFTWLFASSAWGINPRYQDNANEPEKPVVIEQLPAPNSTLELLPRVNLFTPADFVLKGKAFNASYGGAFVSSPTFGVALGVPLFHWNNMQFLFEASAGFGAKSDEFWVSGNGGVRELASIQLLRVPVALGGKVLYAIPGIWFVKPVLGFGVGANWISQSAKMPGFDEKFWIPYLYVTPGLTFFSSSQPSDWFGGFTFGVSLQQSFGVKHLLRAVGMELSVHILL